MGTPILIRTPMPSVEEVAEILGVSKKRRESIERLAQAIVDTKTTRKSHAYRGPKKDTSRKSKAA